MGKILIEENTLIEIANAIRSKTGGTEQIQVSDMANQIKNNIGNEEKKIYQFTLYSYNGNVIETYSFEAGMTWEEFINSSYNTNNDFLIINSGIFYQSNDKVILSYLTGGQYIFPQELVNIINYSYEILESN